MSTRQKGIFISGAFFFLAVSVDKGLTQAGEVTIGPENKIPPYYKAGGRCSPGRGYNASAEAPNYPSTYPKMNLRVFNREVIGFLFELDAKEGWKPWYDQPEGKPTTHEGGPPHYTQTIYIKKGPTAEECKAAKGPYGQ
ncbi:MAG: hypothetical protein ACREQA_25075 [Candidatus Binatia bacterium]